MKMIYSEVTVNMIDINNEVDEVICPSINTLQLN